jgi:hypothetical protein
MTDKTDFSLDITVDPANSFKPLPDRIAFDLCKAYPVPGGKLLLHNTRNGKRAMVMPEVFASLLSCSQFQTLDQHVANIIDKNPGMQGQQTDIRNVLQGMLDAGMMVSAKRVSDVFKRKVETPGGDNQAGAPVVAIITWERPEALERLLKSIVANCDTGKLHRLYVIDDSRETENIGQNRALVEKFTAETEIPLQYFGQDEQQSLLDALAKRLPEHEDAIRFLADQSRWRDYWTSGLARNLALLLSCGHRLVMMDDDSLCDVYNPGQPKPNISFSDDPREAEFFADEQGWAARHQPINPDPINRHMQCLGLTFSEALDVLGQNHLKPASFTNANALLTSELHPDSPVLISECGSLGCPGTGGNTWLPHMAPASLKRMLASEQETTNALNSRLVWSGRNNPHFAPRPNMSQITGFDNRQMLPPYLPIERGEDRLFGNMLDFVFPSAVTLDYPWAVPHLPMPQRTWEEKDRDFAPGNSFPMFFVEQVIEQKSACLASSPAERLKALSAWFSDLAGATGDALEAMYRDTRLHDTSEQLQLLDSLLAADETAPADWQDYLKNGIGQLNTALDQASREDFPLKGFAGAMEGDELVVFWQETWAGFATALKAWPEIREAAADLLGRGGELSL